jgi:hypothetical protein
MSIKNSETPFSLVSGVTEDNFTGIRELGFNERGAFIVNAYTTPVGEPRGTWFTALPISPAEYRRRHPTQAGFVRGARHITLYDDWGSKHTIYAPYHIIALLAIECVDNGLDPRD